MNWRPIPTLIGLTLAMFAGAAIFAAMHANTQLEEAASLSSARYLDAMAQAEAAQR